jgi:hypothetical protein
VPYPAACRPQAWSAAAAVAVLSAALGLDADVPGGTLRVSPAAPSPVGAVRVEGLRLAGRPLAVEVDGRGEVRAADTDADVRVVVAPAPAPAPAPGPAPGRPGTAGADGRSGVGARAGAAAPRGI